MELELKVKRRKKPKKHEPTKKKKQERGLKKVDEFSSPRVNISFDASHFSKNLSIFDKADHFCPAILRVVLSPESVGMSFQDARESFLYDVWSDVEVLELGVALALADDEGGLADQVGLLPLLRLAHPVLLLDVLDLLERRVQIRTGRVDLTGL